MGKERENWWNFAGQLHTLLLLSINMYHSNWSTFLKAMLLQTSSLSDELLKKRQTQGPHPSVPKCPLIQSLSPVTKGNLWPGALQTVDFFFLFGDSAIFFWYSNLNFHAVDRLRDQRCKINTQSREQNESIEQGFYKEWVCCLASCAISTHDTTSLKDRPLCQHVIYTLCAASHSGEREMTSLKQSWVVL